MRHFIVFLALVCAVFGANTTYQQDGSPNIVTGSAGAGTDIANINADDGSYYVVDAVSSSASETADAGAIGCGTSASNSYAATQAADTTYWGISGVKGCGIVGASGKFGWDVNVSFQNVGVPSASVSGIDWQVKYFQSVSSITTAVQIFNFSSGAWDNLATGNAPTSNTLFQGSITTGASDYVSPGNEVHIRIGSTASTLGGNTAPTLSWDYAAVTLNSSKNLSVEHSSQAAAAPSGHTLKQVYVSAKFTTSATAAYSLDIYNWSSALWENCQSASVSSGADTTFTCTKAAGPGDYIDSGTNKIRVRLSSAPQAAAHSLRENFLFYTISYPNLTSVDLQSPLSAQTLCTADLASCSFTMTCKYSCDADYACSNVDISAQFKPSGGSYQNIGSGGSDKLVLGAAETNPHPFASVSAGTTDATTAFAVRGNRAGAGNAIRCSGASSDAGSVDGATETTVAVATFIETSISPGTVPFGSLDPGSVDNPSANNPITITVTSNTNTNVDTYIKASDLTGAGTVGAANLKVAKTEGGAKTSLANAYPGSPYYSSVAPSGSESFYFFLTIPAAQAAGSYSGTADIKTVEAGASP